MAASRPTREVSSLFTSRGHRLAYTEFGEGKRWVLLMPGLLIPALMQEHLARALAAAGSHVLALDPLGHGFDHEVVDHDLPVDGDGAHGGTKCLRLCGDHFNHGCGDNIGRHE